MTISYNINISSTDAHNNTYIFIITEKREWKENWIENEAGGDGGSIAKYVIDPLLNRRVYRAEKKNDDRSSRAAERGVGGQIRKYVVFLRFSAVWRMIDPAMTRARA